jgi:hypothetical protein
VDIKSYPDLIGSPAQIEVTTMSDRSQKFIPGVEEMGELSFTANYTAESFKTLWDLRNTDLELAVFFGGDDSSGVAVPTGDDGVVTFGGQISPSIPGGGVNAAVDMNISVFVSDEMIWYEDATAII